MRIGRRGFFRFLAGAVLAAPSLPALLARLPERASRTVSHISWMFDFDPPLGIFKNHALSRQIREAVFAKSKFLDWMDEALVVGPRGEHLIVTRVRPLTPEPDPAWRERA